MHAPDPGADDPGEAGERLQKVLARAGLGSRRVCDELIAAGRVAVDGETAVLGRRVDPARANITLDGVAVVVRSDLVHYLLHKPRGYVTTAQDPQGRPTVLDLVPNDPRVFPVGRLDYATEGLLVVTNDGDLSQLLTHPSHGVPKTYLVEVDGAIADRSLQQLRRGVTLDDGPTAPARVRLLQRRETTSALEITIHEGRNRQVRRMAETVGHPVRRLVRIRIGTLADTQLRAGEWRPLRPEEVRALYVSASATAPEPDGGRRPSRDRAGSGARGGRTTGGRKAGSPG